MGCCSSSNLPKKKKSKRLTLLKQNSFQFRQGRFLESYKVLEEIGEGAFGFVVKVVHKDSNTIRAAKRIETIDSLDIKEMLKEVKVLGSIDHPNIVHIYEVIQENQMINIVTELCTGGELFDRIQKLKKFTEKQAASYMLDIISAVKYCHDNNIVHRDLKPENILFENETEDSRLKLIDFGTSRFVKANEKMNGMIGSSYYIAPEVISGDYDKKCDVWSLGVILFIMLSGKPPFNGKTDQVILKKIKECPLQFDEQIWTSVSSDCVDLLEKMLKKDPEERISIDKVLEHIWLTDKNDEAKLKRLPRDYLENLRQFSKESYLKRATLYFITRQFISQEEVEELRSIFEKLDVNKDGKLSKQEILEGFNENFRDFTGDLEKIMDECDIDGNGYIDYSEFLTASLNWQKALSVERLKAAFRLYDIDGNGKISSDEFFTIFYGSGMDEEIVKEIIKGADKNDDGEIDFEEFQEYLTKPNRV